jgi:mRNA interferase RelE/StbE
MWKTEFTQTAEKQFDKLDKEIRRTLKRYIIERLETELDPKRFGKPLTGNLKEFWRYRIGDYRLIYKIQEAKVTVLVVRIAHRKNVYD